ncbi:MAG: hypothetical protein WCE99_10260, partial [Nitrososphaeraceae archaeon]
MSEVIALQMDMNEEDVLRVIKEEKKSEKGRETKISSTSSLLGNMRIDANIPLISKLHIDKAVNID